jgi:NodT family efflux transporter outer membrane factor (OMF) lipoprotein
MGKRIILMPRNSCVQFWLCGALTIFVSGCAVHRVDHTPDVTVATHGGYSEVSAAASLPGDVWERSWWTTLGDETLNGLIEAALRNNLGLQEFGARIEQARQLVRQSGASLFPFLDANADYESQWVRPAGGSTARGETASAGGALNWELDLWGRLRSARSARIHEGRAAVNDLDAARLFLSASVAETYFEIIEQRRQASLLRQQMDANETLLDLTRLRFGQGLSSIVDVLQQQEQLAATRTLLPSIEAGAEQLEYALDVLLGQAPGARPRVAASNWPELSPLPAPGVPSDLLRARPDLLAAQNRVLSIDYQVGEAIAARLPRVAIGGSLTALGDPDYSSLASAAFASLVAPVFDAGLRKAEVNLQRARLQEAVARWSQNYLVAVRDVETAIVQERKQGEEVARIAEQLEIARRLLRETRTRYAQGLTDYLPVLNAVVTEQQLERELLATRRLLLSFRVALHRAVGGPMGAQQFAEASR